MQLASINPAVEVQPADGMNDGMHDAAAAAAHLVLTAAANASIRLATPRGDAAGAQQSVKEAEAEAEAAAWQLMHQVQNLGQARSPRPHTCNVATPDLYKHPPPIRP